MGVFKVNPYLVAMDSNCQNIKLDLYFPMGSMPPCFMFNLLLGIIDYLRIKYGKPM